MTYRELCCQGERALAEAGIEEAKLDARLLLEHVCGTTRNDLLVHGDRDVEPEKQAIYEEMLSKRGQRIPLQHITGVQEFMGLEFQVNGHVLIPRQDTEILVEEALKHLHDGMSVLDMCTGSGCILISLLHYSNDCAGVGVDISAEALKVARGNAVNILGQEQCWSVETASGCPDWMSDTNDEVSEKIDEACEKDSVLSKKVTFQESNLFENVIGKFDIIVSNPPYICSEVIETLEPEVRDHEPRGALDGTEDGLFFYRKIVAESREYLTGGGKLLFEIGYDQAEAVSKLMEAAGFIEINVVKDYAGLDRVVYGTLGFNIVSNSAEA